MHEHWCVRPSSSPPSPPSPHVPRARFRLLASLLASFIVLGVAMRACVLYVASTAKVAVVILLSVVLFDTPLTTTKGIGIGFCMAGAQDSRVTVGACSLSFYCPCLLLSLVSWLLSRNSSLALHIHLSSHHLSTSI